MGGVSVLVPTSERRDAGIANDATARKAGATVKRRRDSGQPKISGYAELKKMTEHCQTRFYVI